MRLLLTTLLLGLSTLGRAQTWTSISPVSGQDVTCLQTVQNALLIGTSEGKVQISTDLGATWRTSIPTTGSYYIQSAGEFQGRIFVGTSDHGIFWSADTGRTWTASAGSYFSLSSFTTWGGHFYASSVGSGILKYDAAQDRWDSFTDGLPTYSFNVNRVWGSPDGLLAAAGANGTYYRYNEQSHQWDEQYYVGGTLAPGLSVDDFRQDEGSYYATNGRHVYRSDDGGQSWMTDEAGIKLGQERYMYATPSAQYLLTNDINAGSAWLQWRSKPSAAGDAWSANTVSLPNIYAYGMVELGGKLFVAHGNGVLTAEAPVAATRPNLSFALQAYPNPSEDGSITLVAPAPLEAVWVTSLTGQEILRQTPGTARTQFSLSSGSYIVQAQVGGRIARQRVCVR